MAQISLKTDYKNASFAGERKYQLVNNSDGTISLMDATIYDEIGDDFGAEDVNSTNKAVVVNFDNINSIGTEVLNLSRNINIVETELQQKAEQSLVDTIEEKVAAIEVEQLKQNTSNEVLKVYNFSEGETIQTTDSAEFLVNKLLFAGNSYQKKQEASLNMIREQSLATPLTKTDFWHSIASPFATPLNDGWMKINRTAENDICYVNFFTKPNSINGLKPNKQYTIFVEFRNVNSVGGSINLLGNEATTPFKTTFQVLRTSIFNGSVLKQLVTTKADISDIIYGMRNFAFITANSTSDYELRMMLLEGDCTTKDLVYEDFCYASPSIESPSKIHNVTGDLEIKLSNENLCKTVDGDFETGVYKFFIKNGVISVSQTERKERTICFGDSSFSTYLPTTQDQPVYKDFKLTGTGGKYTIITLQKFNSISTNIIQINTNKKIAKARIENLDATNNSYLNRVLIDLDDDEYISSIYEYFGDNADVNVQEIKIQLLKGAIQTSNLFTEHKEQVLTLPLSDMELHSIENTRDKIIFKDDTWQIERNIKKVDLSSNLDSWWNVVAQNNDETMYFSAGLFSNRKTPISINSKDWYCDKLKSMSYTEATPVTQNKESLALHHQQSSKNYGYVRVFRSRLITQDIDGFKAFLTEQNPIVYYILEEPVYEKITNVNLIDILNRLQKLKTYYEVTNITNTSSDCTGYLFLKYLVSNQIIYNKNKALEERIANLELANSG